MTASTDWARNPAPLCYGRIELIAGLVIQSQQLAAGFHVANLINFERKLDDQQALDLIQEVTPEEVRQAMFSLKDNKAPWPGWFGLLQDIPDVEGFEISRDRFTMGSTREAQMAALMWDDQIVALFIPCRVPTTTEAYDRWYRFGLRKSRWRYRHKLCQQWKL
ncbi:hypothetical protein NE237_028501 [Protea cynaroides]|uniref:Uncharacterized protein n=1 Tax=Protea cynaroides TaxID=273540 RepID=A0A9Q0GTY1_9MAGN|nr:hypothetical protein NE237_028501 [Protea cynaroides]